MMMVHTRAMRAAPFVTMAVMVSSPAGAFAAVLAPLQPRGSGLLARQSGEVPIPPQCDPQCNPIANTINNCPTAECACTSQNMNALYVCMECVVSVDPTELPNTQGFLFNFAQSCAQSGITLNVPTVTAASGATPTPAPTGPKGSATIPTTTDTPPPTGVPLSFGKSASSGTTVTTGTTGTTVTPLNPSLSGNGGPTGNGGGATPTPTPSSAMGVWDRAEVFSMIFSLCLTVVLVLELS